MEPLTVRPALGCARNLKYQCDASRLGNLHSCSVERGVLMSGTTPQLQRLAIEIVANNEPCTANALVRALRRQGASHRAANETLFALIRSGYVRRTWNGKLKLP